MTGYVRRRRVVELDFSRYGNDYDGLVVKVRSVSMGDMLRLSELMEAKVFGLVKIEAIDKAHELLGLFAQALVEWNVLDDDGDPVPATVEGLLSLDDDFNHDLVGAWCHSITVVPPPLEQPSPDGDPSLEQSMPMETS